MYDVYCMNLKTGARFVQTFDSPYKMRLFINKVKHTKPEKREVMIISYPLIDD